MVQKYWEDFIGSYFRVINMPFTRKLVSINKQHPLHTYSGIHIKVRVFYTSNIYNNQIEKNKDYIIDLRDLIIILMSNLAYCENVQLSELCGIKRKRKYIPYLGISKVFDSLKIKSKVLNISIIDLLTDYLITHIEYLDQAPCLLLQCKQEIPNAVKLAGLSFNNNSIQEMRLSDGNSDSNYFNMDFPRIYLSISGRNNSYLSPKYYIYCTSSDEFNFNNLLKDITNINIYLHNIIGLENIYVTERLLKMTNKNNKLEILPTQYTLEELDLPHLLFIYNIFQPIPIRNSKEYMCININKIIAPHCSTIYNSSINYCDISKTKILPKIDRAYNLERDYRS